MKEFKDMEGYGSKFLTEFDYISLARHDYEVDKREPEVRNAYLRDTKAKALGLALSFTEQTMKESPLITLMPLVVVEQMANVYCWNFMEHMHIGNIKDSDNREAVMIMTAMLQRGASILERAQERYKQSAIFATALTGALR